MFPAKHQSPTFVPQLTLASINARHSESPNTAYSKSWMPDYAFDMGIPLFQPTEFQSNSTFEAHASNTPNRAGLGIQYLDPSSDFKLHTEQNDPYIFFPRLEASYSSSGPTFDDADSSFNTSLASSWSLSMLYSEMQQDGGRMSTGSSDKSANASLGESSTTEDLTLESLSAAAGLSVEEFTDKITEGAKYALKKVADYEHAGPITSGQDSYLTSALDAPTFSGVLPLDMDTMDTWFPSCLGINPADVMPGPPLMSTGTSLDDIFNVLGSHMHLANTSLEFPPLPELAYPPTPPLQTMTMNQAQIPATPQAREDGDQFSDYEPPAFLSPSSSEYSPTLGSSRPYHTRASLTKKRKIQICDTMNLSSVAPAGPLPDSTPLPPIDLGSPVFDAHRGIDIEDLKSRAERYRLRNQGREYDKRWLLSYAGKLSGKGELLEEFRCYITGCQQVNKRRDHILIHVGAHLDQRPFKCVHCSARFLRKNECKRHELSHTGVRPFTCHLCPFPATTFVRQDLLRRHMKRTHQIDEEKENKGASSARLRKKARKF